MAIFVHLWKMCLLPFDYRGWSGWWAQNWSSQRPSVFQAGSEYGSMCTWAAQFLAHSGTGTAASGTWAECLKNLLQFKYLSLDSTLIGSVQPLCPAVVCCKHSGYSTHFSAWPASVKSRISFPILAFGCGHFQKGRWKGLSACSVGWLGSDSLGSTLAWDRPRESWGLFFTAFCQAARPNPFRHKEGIFRITNVQSVTS